MISACHLISKLETYSASDLIKKIKRIRYCYAVADGNPNFVIEEEMHVPSSSSA